MHKICADAFGTNAETADSKYCQSLTGGAVLRGTQVMEIVPTDEKNVRRAIRTGVGEALCCYYGELLKEPIPGRLTDLLRRLDEPKKAYPEKQE